MIMQISRQRNIAIRHSKDHSSTLQADLKSSKWEPSHSEQEMRALLRCTMYLVSPFFQGL